MSRPLSALLRRARRPLAFALPAALAVSALLAASPAQADPVPECTVDPSIFLLTPYPGDATQYRRCDHGEDIALPCPTGLAFNPVLDVCDWPENAYADTRVTALGNAKLNLLQAKVTGLSARLEYAQGSSIVHAGFTISFTDAQGTVLCTATTNNSGIATCDSPSGLLTSITTLLLGYTATFTSSQSNLGSSSDHGIITQL